MDEIARFSGVEASTAHYHLKKLIRQKRIEKYERGKYRIRDDSFFKNRENSNFKFQKIRKSRENVMGVVSADMGLNHYETQILMEVLKKDNVRVPFTTDQIAENCKISVNTVLKYSKKLEEKGLITREMSHGRYVFLPTQLAIEAITEFFSFFKNRENLKKRYSKTCKLSLTPKEINNDKQHPPPEVTPVTFDTIIKLIRKNAHRFIIQFSLLRCSHRKLRGTAWIFGKKNIRKHYPTAYVFKSKNPKAHVINVLPKDPFIFYNEIEFQTKMVAFVNDLVDVLRDDGIVLDLSQPAEIRMEHLAREDDPFATKIIEEGMLYFKCKTSTQGPDGEEMTYVVGIDKSKAFHFEIEGVEAHHLAKELDAFVDDVIHGHIPRQFLRKLPEKFTAFEKDIVTTQTSIEETQATINQNLAVITENMVSHIEYMKTQTEAMKQREEVIKAAEQTYASTLKNFEETLSKFTEAFQNFIQKAEESLFQSLLRKIKGAI